MKKLLLASMTALSLVACGNKEKPVETSSSDLQTPTIEEFDYLVDRFADLQILRYRVPDIDQLSLQQQELLYYLSEASLVGRDILYDQNGCHNLIIRTVLEAIYTSNTDKENDNFKAMETYLKRVWVSNGIHHHYSGDKFTPEFSQEWFVQQVNALDASILPEGRTIEDVLEEIVPVIFDPTVDAKHMNQTAGEDLILTSASNYYGEGVTQAEAEAYYNNLKDLTDEEPVSYGLNAKLIKEDGVVKEQVYKVGGLYTEALEKVVYWLEKAAKVAENDQQRAVINKLIEFNKTGVLKTFDEYAILWVNDTASHIDFVNGFTETYGDPLGMTASWESMVNFKNTEATKRTKIISDNAQYFEDASPVDSRFKKEKVKGVTAKVITAAIIGGDCYPTTPIGINLPNSNWIRAAHGSKSVTIENFTEAYDRAQQGNGFAEEFVWSDVERDLMSQYGFMTDNLHTDLHECLGHGSGKLLPGVDPDAMRSYSSVIEETRADLFGLYHMGDPKVVELGLLPNADAYKAQYYSYFMNGLMTQLKRIHLGDNVEEAHMRNRQLITRWVLEKSKDDKAVELKKRDGKTYVVINDYNLVRTHLGELLAEIQRIKSTGDYEAGKNIVENYAVKVDPTLHKEVLERFNKLNIAPYFGFVNPVYTATFNDKGEFAGLKIDYTEGYAEQHLRYSRDYSLLTKKEK
ncbi:MAG: dihydrofolate reductase [Bacteroidales bacterium]|nr:dihydrofolate reductase [Bacteroidales bacterium]